MLFVTALLLLLPATSADPQFTYAYEDPLTGITLHCALCEPGTYVQAPCTRTRGTQCAPCPRGYYTQYANYLHRCLSCRAPCDHNQHQRHECAPTSDRECECAPGHYWRGEQCVRHTRCSQGFGVKHNGTMHKDTQCVRCEPGTFSKWKSAYAQCTPHSGCSEKMFVVLRGTSWHDDVCVSCTEFKSKGTAALLQRIMPKLFVSEKVNKLNRFVHLYGTQKQKLRSPLSKKDILKCIREWTQSAQEEQLKNLPAILHSLKLQKTAKELRRMLNTLKKIKCN